MPQDPPNHYQTLGLNYDCTLDDIKAAYRFLARENHPDLHPHAAEARQRTQQLNAAYETLGNSSRRREYDRQLSRQQSGQHSGRSSSSSQHDIRQDIHLKIEQLLRGASIDVRVDDPANPDEQEVYPLVVPPMTAPGARFRVSRSMNPGGGKVVIRIKPLPDFRFRPRGSDLRCELNVSKDFARSGGKRSIEGPTGESFEFEVPENVERGFVVRIEGQGLPKLHGGRGDILVRVTYQPGVRVDAFRMEE